MKLTGLDLALAVFLLLWFGFWSTFIGAKQIIYTGKVGGASVYEMSNGFEIKSSK